MDICRTPESLLRSNDPVFVQDKSYYDGPYANINIELEISQVFNFVSNFYCSDTYYLIWSNCSVTQSNDINILYDLQYDPEAEEIIKDILLINNWASAEIVLHPVWLITRSRYLRNLSANSSIYFSACNGEATSVIHYLWRSK
jgi:hypothetical protein